MHADITFAITSCGRFDLLCRTMESFFRFNTFPIRRFLLVEDSADPAMPELIRAAFGERVEVIFNETRLGHIRSLDRLYSQIDTPYIFHCEDDWEFVRSGFVERSLEVLQDLHLLNVWLRGPDDTNGHPVEAEVHRDLYRLMVPDYLGVWGGFTLNPGLRRLSDYHLIAPFVRHGLMEQDLSMAYRELGFRAATLLERYVRHIGEERHVYDPYQGR